MMGREGSVRDRGLLVNRNSTRSVAVMLLAMVAVGLAGCGDGADPVERAQAQVTAKEKAVADAEAELAAASAEFCQAAENYIFALDRYGDILNETAPTVGDVRAAGADLAEPGDDAFSGAEAAVEAQEDLVVAQQELADARAALAAAQAASGSPMPEATTPPSPAPLAPAASVDRVTQAETEFATAQSAVTDETTLVDASEQFNSAAVALELAWMRLFVDAGCITDEQEKQAVGAVIAYTTALQQQLAETGYYTGEVDGVYGPLTVQAVEALQEANGLPVTGTMDKATTEALQAELLALGGEAAQESIASTAALQQTLALVGFWDGPIDGMWTPELTEALKEFQVELGVEPTGTVDAATLTAFEKALSELQNPPTPSPTPSATPTP
jgi:murein L,D-transpeptidase YcbB/YkuD